jgi:hypothetical protein
MHTFPDTHGGQGTQKMSYNTFTQVVACMHLFVMHVCEYMCLLTWLRTSLYVYVQVCLCTCPCACVSMCLREYVHTHTYIHTYVHTYIHTHRSFGRLPLRATLAAANYGGRICSGEGRILSPLVRELRARYVCMYVCAQDHAYMCVNVHT